jgi:hypothetical protein
MRRKAREIFSRFSLVDTHVVHAQMRDARPYARPQALLLAELPIRDDLLLRVHRVAAAAYARAISASAIASPLPKMTSQAAIIAS